MKIISGTTQFEIEGNTAVAIGKFDGIHRGHQLLLGEVCKCKEDGLLSVVFTFDPPPSVLFGSGEEKELMPRDEKRFMFEAKGIDVLIEYPLTRETAAIEPELFIRRILCEQMHARVIAAGPDVSFGNRGAGNLQLLQAMAKELNMEVHVVEKVCYYGREISSTYVRSEVERGNMELVKELLGTPYQITGVVEHGNHMGTSFQMPTVNVIPPENKLLPPFGVYFSRVRVEDKVYNGVTNIGRKPTIREGERTGVETYLYDYSGDLYGRVITVELLAFSRPEQKFENVDALKAQLMRDTEDGIHYHKG